jgi:mannose-6-phosphate isomerase-like protein (cupin superfamily)
VVWAPQVIEDARDHGLVLAETGKLYDTKRGQRLPEGVRPMPVLTPDELAGIPETPAGEVVPRFVRRYWDMKALAAKAPMPVIGSGDDGRAPMIRDRTGFEVEFLQRGQEGEGAPYRTDRHEVLLVHKGHWRLAWPGGATTLAPGDTCAVPPGLERSIAATMGGETALFLVRNTDDDAGPTRH